MMGWRGLLLLFVWASAGLGCASTQEPDGRSGEPGPAIAEYVPLQLGSRWTYAMKYPGQSGEMTVTIQAIEDGYFIDDKKGALRITNEGLRDRQRYLIKAPLVEGNRWKTVVSASAVEHAQITSVGKPCESVAGEFPDCLVVDGSIRRDKNMTLHIRWTWAKGVGLVKVTTEAEIEGKGRIPQTSQSLKTFASLSSEPKREGDSEGAPETWER